jgi:hypothetical protein
MKFPIVALLSFVATSSAFVAPSKKTSSSSALNSYENELGAIDPVGKILVVSLQPSVQSTNALSLHALHLPTLQLTTGFFDPLGLSTNLDPEQFKRYRAGEIKNGRVAMLAVLGYVVPEFYRFPGELYPGLKFADIPNGAFVPFCVVLSIIIMF